VAERGRPDKLGEILLAMSLITPEQLQRAVETQFASGKRLGQVLVEQGAATEDDVAWALSNQLRYPYVFLTQDLIDAAVVHLFPEEFLRERHVLPIHKFGQQVTLAMADPTDQHTVDEVMGQTGLQVNRAVARASNIEEVLRHVHAQEGGEPQRMLRTAEDQYVQFHLAQALQQGASEIHFDPAIDGQPRVRYRLQGVLVDQAGHPEELHAGVLSHLLDLAGLGQASAPAAVATTVTVGEIEARVVIARVPTTSGPLVTITLAPYRAGPPDLVPLGVDRQITGALRGALEGSHGAFVVGCNDPGVRSTLIRGILPGPSCGKIWALETLPIYRDPMIHQTVIESPDEARRLLLATRGVGADLIAIDDASSASALVAALEVARTRTVVIGYPEDGVVGLLGQLLEAAGDALPASTLTGLLAARPIRMLCPECKERLRSSPGAAHERHTFTPRGCTRCSFTGFRGVRLLTEVWLVTSSDRWRLRAGPREATLTYLSQGVGSAMRDQGQMLVEDGLTSVAELSRVMGGV
jgi:type II secretory ATPase GspE/PulE/Tfp pilus assembly ATPase PilB-like protein